MSRGQRIQLVISLGVVVVGIMVATLGAQAAYKEWLTAGGLDDVDSWAALHNQVDFWSRIGRFIVTSGMVYAIGLVVICFIGPKESNQRRDTSATNDRPGEGVYLSTSSKSEFAG